MLLIVAAILIVALPCLAAAMAARRSDSSLADVPVRLAVGYGGLAIAAWSLWWGTMIFGFGAWIAGAAPVAAAALLLAVVAAGSRRRQIDARPEQAGHQRVPSERLFLARLLAAGVVFAILVAIPFQTFGWERADGVHRLAMTDWYKHLVVTSGLDGSSVFPPANPFLHTMTTPSYYFGFHLVAAAINRVGAHGADVYVILLGLTLMTGIAFPFVVFTFASRLGTGREAWTAAIGATFLTGFDLVVVGLDTLRNLWAAWPFPGGFATLRALVPSTHVDYWIHHNERQLNTAYVTTAWAPQHTAGVLVALIVVYLLAPDGEDPPRASSSLAESPRPGLPALLLAVFPAVLLAALPAISAYVALGLGFGVVAAVVADTVAERRPPWLTPTFNRWLWPSVLALPMALPILYNQVSGTGESTRLILHVSDAGGWSNGAVFSSLFGEHTWSRLLDTPAVYLMELGMIGVLGAVELLRRLRTRTLSPSQRQVAAMAAGILLVIVFVRPPLDGPNNLYARPGLLALCLLAPLAAMAARRLWHSRLLRVAVAVCALGTAYAVVGYVLEGALFWSIPRERVEALRWVNRSTAPDEVVAVHPDDYDSGFGLFLRRPLLLADERHALLLGAGQEQFADTAARLRAAYAAEDPGAAWQRFDSLGAGIILLPATDDVGREPWLGAGCFEIGYENAAWRVVLRRPTPCD